MYLLQPILHPVVEDLDDNVKLSILRIARNWLSRCAYLNFEALVLTYFADKFLGNSSRRVVWRLIIASDLFCEFKLFLRRQHAHVLKNNVSDRDRCKRLPVATRLPLQRKGGQKTEADQNAFQQELTSGLGRL